MSESGDISERTVALPDSGDKTSGKIVDESGKAVGNVYKEVHQESAPDGSWTSSTEYYEAVSFLISDEELSLRIYEKTREQ